MQKLFSIEEIELFRGDTEGCAFVNHLNNAGSALMPAPVVRAIQHHIALESKIGGYEAAALQSEEIEKFYRSAAKLLHCAAGNIAFTANATDAFNRAISSIPFNPGDVILTTNEDYISYQITYLVFEKRFGVRLIRAKSLASGGVDLADFERCLVEFRPRLVSVTHVPTNSGLIQPIEKIGALCASHRTIYMVDACQSVGQMPLDVQAIQSDFMSFTSRKFLRGPRGAGFLYVSDKILKAGYEPLFMDMRGADWVSANRYIPQKNARRFEDWEFAYALLLGTGAAIDYYLHLDAERIEYHIKFLANYIRQGLLEIEGIRVYDKGSDPAGIVSFHLDGSDPDYIKNYLSGKKINVTTSNRNVAVIDFDEKQVDWTIRVSPHYYITIRELDQFLGAVKEIAFHL
jgi:selenocysteine lyase/cysteine desulfurase